MTTKTSSLVSFVHRSSLACAVVVSALTCAAYSEPASACGNAVEVVVDPRAEAVSGAENALKSGDSTGAARRVLTLYPALRGARIEPASHEPLLVRSAHILAVAIVRTDGRTSFGESTSWARSGNLEWAVTTLREVSAWKQHQETSRVLANRNAKVESPDLAADLGEALAMQPHTRAEAKKLLESLDRRDLLGSAHAYRALAKLRAEDGEADASRVALDRCRMRAKRPETCVLPLPPAKL
jgi:hypothetical protein